MANSFGQYTGGIQGVQGISEAGANIGKFMQVGLESAGSGLAEGLKAYNDNVAKDAMLTEQLKGLGSQLMQTHDTLNSDPEFKGMAANLQPLIDQFSKAPSMSMSQKQGLLLSGQTTMQGINQQYTLQSQTNINRTRQGIDESKIDTEKFGEPTVQNVHLAIRTPFNPNVDYATQRAAASAEVDKFLAANPTVKNADKEAYLDAWHDKWKAIITNTPADKLNADTRASLLKQFDSAQGLKDNSQTGDNGVTDYSKESEMYTAENKSAVQAKYDALKATAPSTQEAALTDSNATPKLVTAKEKFTAATSSLQESIDSDNEKIDALKMEKAYAKVDKTTGISEFKKDRELRMLKSRVEANKGKMEVLDESQFKDDVAPVDKIKGIKAGADNEIELLKKRQTELEANIKADTGTSYFTKNSSSAERTVSNVQDLVKRFVAWNAEKAADTNGALATSVGASGYLPPTVGGALAMAGQLGMFDNRTQAEKDLTRVAIEKELAKRFPQTAERELESVKSRLSTLGNVSAEAGKAITPVVEAPKPEALIAAPTDAQGRHTEYGDLGVQYQEHLLTWQEKKAKMQDWFRNKQGFVPAAFDKIFTDTHPESKLATAKTDVGDMWYDGDKWHLAPVAKAMSVEEQQKNNARIFGKVNSRTGEMDFSEVVTGSGIMVKGIANGSTGSVQKFTDDQKEAANTMNLLRELVEINRSPLEAKVMPSIKARSGTIVAELRAVQRAILFKGARATEWEQKILHTVVPDPSDIFTLPSSTLERLDEIKSNTLRHLKDNAEGKGLQFEYHPPDLNMKNEYGLSIKLANRKKTN